MKKLFVFVMTMVLSVSFVLIPVNASDSGLNNEITPKEILRVTKDLQSVSSTGATVTITITYTYRYEPSNATGRYITGILNGYIKSHTGWYYVNNLNVYTNSVTYSLNNQIAKIPVSYSASMGASTIFNINDVLTLSMYG